MAIISFQIKWKSGTDEDVASQDFTWYPHGGAKQAFQDIIAIDFVGYWKYLIVSDSYFHESQLAVFVVLTYRYECFWLQ